MRSPSRPHVLALGLIAALVGASETATSPQAVDVTAGSAAEVQREADAASLAAACDDATFLLAAGRAREAVGRLQPVLLLVGVDHPLRARGQALVEEALAAEARADIRIADGDRTEAINLARQRVAQAALATASLRTERIARVRDLQARGHRELALAQLRTLLHDLPGDDEVDAMFRDLLDETHAARTKAIAERERELRAELSLRVERSLIPEGFDGRPMYPSDWSKRRSDRDSILDAPDRMPAWQQAISDRLAARVSVSFEATPVAEAIEVVSRLSGTNIIASPELLAATDRIVTMRVVGMRLEDVLTWIAEQAGTRWSLANGAVFLGDAAQGATVTALHDLGELLVGTGDFPGIHLELANNAGGGGGGAGGLFGTSAAAAAVPATADNVADLIRRSVSPTTWTNESNVIAIRGNALVVTAPAEVQRLIREFLRAQSAQRNLSVRVDARWLQLDDRYVEEIGVQWTSGSSQMIDPGAGQRGGVVRSLDGWAVNGSTTNNLPSTAMAVQPGTAGTGLTLQSAMLGTSKLSAVLSAVERNTQGRVLQSPELTCLNGQQANTFFGSQIAYISDYEIVSNRYDPVIEVLNIGAMLEVRPLVSADRKYVTLEMRTAISSASLFTEVITTAVVDEGSGLDTDGDGVVDQFQPMTNAYPIELPNVAIRTAGTTVMLPDRGSLLVGGFNAGIDQFSTTRVPLLGSVPFLGRLFGARGRYSDKRHLYLLTTATIINYPELEARL